MSERQTETEGRTLTTTEVGGYKLLNSEKLNRVLDLLDGITQPANETEARILSEAQALNDNDMCILALYDRLGGGIKDGDRKVRTGAFFDFKARKPRTKVVDLTEDEYEDEMVLVRKKSRKASTKETESERIKRLERDSGVNLKSEVSSSKEETEDEEKTAKKAVEKTAKKA